MAFKRSLRAFSFLSIAAIEVAQGGSYSYTTGMLLLDRVKVQTQNDNYYAQISLRLSESEGKFTDLTLVPLADTYPSADATLSFDAATNSYILTVLNASGYYGVLTSKTLTGSYTSSNVINIQGNLVGATGASGEKGDPGEAGPKGDKGDKGDTGATGLNGNTGAAGAMGPKGDQGDTGLTGLKGDTGEMGFTGPKGDKGDTGPAGLDGADGLTTSVNGITHVGGAITLTKANFNASIQLDNVDNTSDVNKPVSTATQTALDLKAPLASPALTGTPSAPTAAPGTNTTQLATTAFVNAAVRSYDYKIGDVGPGGGYIFYVDYQDEYPGFTYLEMAPADVPGSFAWCDNTNTAISGISGWASTAVGLGQANTTAMLTVCNSGAAKEADAYENNNVSDWFLPSLGELMLLYTNMRQAGIGNFGIVNCWSSSQYDANQGLDQDFVNGKQYYDPKTSTFQVRPIRAF